MTDITANLGLPVIAAAQAQKHVTHNEALRLLDTLVQLAVIDRDLGAPPATPGEGERWIVAASPTGAWAGHANDIAAWQDGAWQFSTPRLGWAAFVADEGTLLVWNGSAWGDFFATVTSIQNLARLGVGTTADATNPVSAKLNNTLWTARTVAEGGDGDLRYKLNKESAANVLSLLFQDASSGRAEIGLVGDDDFRFKVSPDGSAWFEGLAIDRASGGVRFLANETDVASASTCDIGAAASLKVRITGTTAIASFGAAANAVKLVRFADALTLAHDGTSLILPGAADIATAAGDTCIAVSDASGNWRVASYARADGQPLTVGAATLASAATVDLSAVRAQAVTITGVTTIASFGSSAPTGAIKSVDFTAALTLTHNATSLILPDNADITTAAGARAQFQHLGSGNWACINYQHPGGVEIGSWTPAITFATPGDLSVSYSTQGGSYTKVGRAVTLKFDLITSAFTHTTASSSLFITGNPFTALAGTGVRGQLQWSGITKAGFTNMHTAASGANIVVQACGSGVAAGAVVAADVPTGGSVILRGWYGFLV